MASPTSDPDLDQRLAPPAGRRASLQHRARTGLALALILLGGGAAAWFAGAGNRGVAEVPGRTSGQVQRGASPQALESTPVVGGLRVESNAGEPSASRPDASEARSTAGDTGETGDALLAMLESLAELEGRILIGSEGSSVAELRDSIEALLRPHLEDPDTHWVVVSRLTRGDFVPDAELRRAALAAGSAPLSRAEFGALRYLYWSIALAGSPESDWYTGDLGTARERLEASLGSLAEWPAAVGLRWPQHVGDLGSRLPGLIDGNRALAWLEDLRLAGGDPRVHQALAMALAPFLGGSVNASDLIAQVDQSERPAEIGRALQLLMESGEAELGLELALGVLGRPGVDGELQAAVFDAVRRGAPVGLAVDFVAENLELLGRPANPFLGIGYRDDAPEALYERYLSELAGNGLAREGDPHLRRLLVGGLAKLDAARLEDIARHDGDLEVRSQAWLKLLNQDDGDPDDLFELAADVLATPAQEVSMGEARFYLRGCLGALLGRGDGQVRDTALDYVRQLARTAPTPAARRQHLDVHAAHADPEVHRQFVLELGL